MSAVRVACVQATPVPLDGPASVRRACELIGEAGAAGARLVALPECFVPLYPNAAWAHGCARFSRPAAELHRRLWENAIEVPGPEAERLAEAARRAGTWVAIGINERDARRPGTLWNTLLWLSPDGAVAGLHRKLMPTLHERVVHGIGPGDDLDVMAAPGVGRLGGLICWENFMPMARRRLHQGGADFYVAPTADDRDLWAAAMRGFAFEAGAFLLSPIQYVRRADYPEDFPLAEELAGCSEVLLNGGSLIADPWGNLLAGPVYGREEILVADCDLGAVLAARRVLDTAGHYDRPDLEESL
jgi:nitrilase